MESCLHGSHVVQRRWGIVYVTRGVVPPTRRPQVRSKFVKPQHVDIYGYRPLLNSPFSLLSVYEFYMYYYAEPLRFPRGYEKGEERTEWTAVGEHLWGHYATRKRMDASTPIPQFLPGKHFIVLEPLKGQYYTFQQEPTQVFDKFRHTWVIVRNKRPHVPVLQGNKLPGPACSAEDNAQYCSLFFRPWSMCLDTADVPYLPNMGVIKEKRYQALQQGQIKRRRFITKTTNALADWPAAWDEYIRGDIVSKHAARIIKTFLVNTFGASGDNRGDDVESVDASDVDDDIPPLRITIEDARALVNMQLATPDSQTTTKSRGFGEKRGAYTQQYDRAMQISKSLFASNAARLATAGLNIDGPMHPIQYAQHKLNVRRKPEKEEQSYPFRGATAPKAELYYTEARCLDVNSWLVEVAQRQVEPNIEQLSILQGVAHRIKEEMGEEQSITKGPNPTDEEPLLDLVHGLPGTGKTEVIKWLLELFALLGWENGVQYVCLAVQNVMAAQIAGYTIRNGSGIPTGQKEGAAGTKDTTALSIKCQCLRFILIDEISMVPAELLAALEHVVQTVVKAELCGRSAGMALSVCSVE